MSKLYEFFELLVFLIVRFFPTPQKVFKVLKIIFSEGLVGFFSRIKKETIHFYQKKDLNKVYKIWIKKNFPTKKGLAQQKKKQKRFRYRPKISIITPIYNPEKQYLIECMDSVLSQTYDNWELCLVDDASIDPKVREIIKEYAQKDKRIKYKFRRENGHICRASNDALTLATGEFVGFLDHDDILWPNALYEVIKLLNKKPYVKFVYSDEDRLSYRGIHVDPFFKPDWSPDYLRSVNYITHFTVIKKELVERVGGFRVGTEGAQDWDLFLRVTYLLDKTNKYCHPLSSKNPIQHIPKILYSWRKTKTSTASERHVKKVKRYAFKNQKKVLEEDLKRRGYEGWAESTEYLGLWRVRYKVKGNPLVSVIIPTKDKYEYISRCLNSILKKTTYKNFELVIVDTGSIDKRVCKLYEKVRKKHPKTQVLKWNKEFNFSAVCNYGVNKSKGDYFIFLNNDTEVITNNWIEGLLGYAQLEHVGAVGCKLLYPNGEIQHAGIVLGIKGGNIEKGVAGHVFKGLKDGVDYLIYNSSIYGVKNTAGVTAACLMIDKRKFLKFDERFKIAFNDVDFNLRLLKKGCFNVYVGFVKIHHYESVSVKRPNEEGRDIKLFEKEIKLMYKKWDNLLESDPFYNINFSLEDEKPTLKV